MALRSLLADSSLRNHVQQAAIESIEFKPSLCEAINFSYLCLSLHLGAEFGFVPEHQSAVSRFISQGACAGDRLHVNLL